MYPAVALIVPVITAEPATSAPAADTRNGASENAVAPAQNPAPGFICTRVTPDPAYSPSVASIVNPATEPDVARSTPPEDTANGFVAMLNVAAPSQMLPPESTWNDEASDPPMSMVPP